LFQDHLDLRAARTARLAGRRGRLGFFCHSAHAGSEGTRTCRVGGPAPAAAFVDDPFEGCTSCEGACRREGAHESRAGPASHPGHGVREGDRDPDRLPRHRGRRSAPGRRGTFRRVCTATGWPPCRAGVFPRLIRRGLRTGQHPQPESASGRSPNSPWAPRPTSTRSTTRRCPSRAQLRHCWCCRRTTRAWCARSGRS
jgi:hypothetical protein